MKRSLREQISKQSEFASLEEEAMLNIARTASELSGHERSFFKGFGLSPAAYNLLRILRGHHGREGYREGVRASEIGSQMVVRMPDVTRLVDRLESRGLVKRSVSAEDKRVKYVQITRDGLGLLGEIDPQISEVGRSVLGHMTSKDLKTLSRLLERARERSEEGRENEELNG